MHERWHRDEDVGSRTLEQCLDYASSSGSMGCARSIDPRVERGAHP